MKHIFTVIFISVLIVSCNNTDSKKEYQIAQNTTSKSSQDGLAESMERGAVIYTDFCKQCHRPKGKGLGKNFPPLAGSDYLMNNRIESIRAVKYGQQGEIVVNDKVYNSVMAPMGLSDDEVADVMNYVMNSWGNTQDKMVTEEEVANVEKE